MTTDKWPNLMTYIHNRNDLPSSAEWCGQLRMDEAAALRGGYADVACELEAAQTAYGEAQRALGRSDYPYNSAMGEFLGLALGANHEPQHGYYMACQVAEAYRTGVADRAVRQLVAAGRPLKIVAARDKATRQPIRFFKFAGSQIQVEGNAVTCQDGKRRIRLSSNWSASSCLQAVRKALETGAHYGS